LVRLLPWRLEQLLLAAIVILFGAVAFAEDAPGLAIETGSPDAFCPDLAQTREAVSRRLGSLEVQGRRGWRASYTIGHAPEGSPRDFVRLELWDPEGVSELVRDLPMSGESCSTMAEAIALVLERHFRSLSPEEREVVSADARSARTFEPRQSKLPPSSTPAPRALSRAAKRTRPGLVLGELAWTAQRPPALGVRALTSLAPSLQLGGAVLLDLGYQHEALPMGGEARAARGELRGWLAWSVRRDPWLAYLGPSLGLSLERGETRGLPERSSLLRVLWAGGLEAAGVWCISPRLATELSFAFSATATSLSGRFYVDSREVLGPQALSAQVGLAAGYAF
jgi:hypothetical protein